MELAGLLFNSFRGLMRILEPKQEPLLAASVELGRADACWSLRELDSVKGPTLT